MSSATGSKYYDIHDILAGEIAVPCTLKTRVNSCGRALDQSSDGTDLSAGHNLELPLWLVSDAAQRKMVSVKWVFFAVTSHILHRPAVVLPYSQETYWNLACSQYLLT